MVERLVEDPHGAHVRIRRQVLVAEHEDLVLPEVRAQALGGLVVDVVVQVEAGDLGAEDRARAVHFVGGGAYSGHADLLRLVVDTLPS